MLQTTRAPRKCVPPRLLSRREREDIADARWQSGQAAPYHMCIVDEGFAPVPGTGLDLVVAAHTEAEAFHVWERWAEDERGAIGVHRVMATYTAPAKGRRRAEEREFVKIVDLDALLLEDELHEIAAADRALGL